MPRRPATVLFAAALSTLFATAGLAGTAQRWDSVPDAVRKAVLANGGKPGEVDLESEKVDGKALYEASVKGDDGVVKDLDITEDGKLVETKTDDAADAAAERAARGTALLKGVTFAHPTQITNPYLPLPQLRKDVLEGTEAGEKVHVDRTPKPEVHKTFKINGQDVEAAAFEDRETREGKLEEVTVDYFAQDDAGTVYYLGEEVDEYKDDKIVGHGGGWMLNKDTEVPGVILPGTAKVGQKFRSEDVSADISEKDEIVSLDETVTVPAGTFAGCLKVKEQPAGEKPEYKYYAKGVGVVREVPADGDELLVSHATR